MVAMDLVTLVLIGAALVMLGWYWGGVTDSRTTVVATGVPAALLLGVAIFSAAAGKTPALPIWAMAGSLAVWAGLMAATTRWEISSDRTLGLYSLFVVLVTLLAAGALVRSNVLEAVAAVILAIDAILIFITSGVIPAVRGFRMFVGWITLIVGAVVTIIGFAPAFGL